MRDSHLAEMHAPVGFQQRDSWDCSSMNRKTMLPFSWPVHVHKQAHHLPQKSWGNGRAGPYKGNKGKGRGRGWRGVGGVSVQCVEIGRPELVGGRASKARAQPPHSHQLRGMWRQRTRASSAAPQPYSFSFFHHSAEQESGFPASLLSCGWKSTANHHSDAWGVLWSFRVLDLKNY